MSKFKFKNAGKDLKKDKRYDDISNNECNNVIQFILDNIDDPATKMLNPKTNKYIEIQNDVSRLILSNCWQKYSDLHTKIKKIANIHDIDPLISSSVSPNGAAKSIKSAASVSPNGAAKSIKSAASGSPNGAAKSIKSAASGSPNGHAKSISINSNSYEYYYNKLHTINDTNLVDFIVTNGNYIKTYDNNEIKKLLEYMQSCNEKYIPSIELSFKEYMNHIKIIVTILENLFNKLELKGSENDIKIIGYDKKSIPLFKNYIDINENTAYNNACIKNMNLFSFEYIKKVNNQNIEGIYDVNTIICNSIFNKLFILDVQITKKTLDIGLNPEFDENLCELTAFDLLKKRSVASVLKQHDFEKKLTKHNKIFPKYFIYQDSTKKGYSLKVKNDLDLIFAILNYYCERLSDYIKIQNSDIKHNESLVMMNTIYNNNNEDNSKLLCCLYNNNYNIHNNNYHNNYYDGPYYLNIINCYKYYYELFKFQNRNIPDIILNNIESSYKNNGVYPFSKLLNEELYSLIKDKITLTIPIQSRLIEMYKYLDHTIITPNTNETLYLYHGKSNTKLTESNLNEVVIMGFLSCSFNLNVAYAYSCNSVTNIANYIYVLQIHNTIDYINFNDNLKQIILLPGTIIIIKKEIIIGNITYIICSIKLPHDKLFNVELRKAIIKNNQELINLGNYFDIIFNNHMQLNKTYHTIYRNNFYILERFINNSSDYYIYCKLNNNNNTFNSIKYTLHQHLINDIYSYFIHKDNTIEYKIVYSNGPDDIKGIYTAWLLDDNYVSAIGSNVKFQYNIDMVLIDSLLENDKSEPANYLISKTYNTDGFTKRINFKGGLLYDNNLNERMNYFDKKMTLYELIHCLDINMNTKLNPFEIDKYEAIINKCNSININKFSIHLSEKYDKIINFFNLKNKEQTDKLILLKTQIIELFKDRCNLLFEKNDDIRLNILKKTGGLETQIKPSLSKLKPSVLQLSKIKPSVLQLSKIKQSTLKLSTPEINSSVSQLSTSKINSSVSQLFTSKINSSVSQLSKIKQSTLKLSTKSSLINDIKLDNVDFPIKNIVTLKEYNTIYKNILKMNHI